MKAVFLNQLPGAGIVMILLGGILLPDVLSAQSFRILDLGTLGGASSAANALDDNNTVVGWSEALSGQRHAFSSCPTCEMHDLGHLPGGSTSSAAAISSNGHYIVGFSGINEFGIPFEQITQGFILSNDILNNNAMLSVGALYCPCTFNTRYGFSEAHAVNDQGEVAGHSETVRGRQIVHAFLWKDGVLEDIGNGAGDRSVSSANALNNASQIAGDLTDSGTPEPARRAFLWQNGSRQNLGVLPGHRASSALGINDDGMVVGWSGNHDGSSPTAFLWHQGIMQNLGYLPGDSNSRAVSINNVGQIVGISGNFVADNFTADIFLDNTRQPDTPPDVVPDAGAASVRPFLWQNGSMLDLNSLLPPESEWLIIDASDINNRGWIAGTGLINGQIHAVLLEPTNPVRQ